MLNQLEHGERLRLMKFVCSFAWADLEIHPEERKYVAKLIKRLGLDEKEAAQVDAWLALPPHPETVDPTSIPAEHRKLFVQTVEEIIAADGEVAPEERETLGLFKLLLR
jgi:uncharacterized tellurite resistance protein B-like protein